MDFQFTSTIAYFLDGPAIGRQFSTVFTITNWVAMLVQFFLTSFIMTRFGLTTALLILPAAIIGGSLGFIAFPILWMGSLLNTADNGFSYSINQSAKETLYVPTTRDEKYKAKAFIDMFVQRFAKALAVGVSLFITTLFADFSTMRWLSLFTIAVVILWVFAARYAGKRFHGMTGE
jgi:AAA family ATP:ADP antiporter